MNLNIFIDGFKNVTGFLHEKYNKSTIIMYFVHSAFINLILEMLGRKSFLKGIYHVVASPYVFVINTLILMMIFSVTLLFRRRIFFVCLLSVIWIAFGIANCALLSYRVTPFSYTDLILFSDALDVANKYLNVFSVVLIVLLAIAAVAGLIFIWIKVPKVDHKIHYIRDTFLIFVISLITFGSINLGINAGVLAVNFGNLADAYLDYGFVYCFSNSVVNRGVSKPKGYSEDSVTEIVEQSDDSKLDVTKAKTPNIIFIQLESFFDITRAKNIEISSDPTPIFNSLLKKYPSGYLDVPVVGAGTVNTEFEVLTGMNMDDFGPGEMPYKTILRETTCETMSYNLKEYGYSTHAIHNNTATFYGRNEVFSNFGFDTFTSVEFMQVQDFTPVGWAKDSILVDEIMDTLEYTEDQPDFIYTITVQSHGSYPTTGEYESGFEVSSAEGYDVDEGVLNAISYYCQEINEVDDFVGELIEELSAYDEDVILVMYGDHLPSLGFTAEDLENENIYQTEYVIWSNFDIDYESEDVQAYQLEAKVLGGLGITSGAINKYNQTNADSEEYLNGLQTLEYDILYGDKLVYDGENPYEPTELQMGLKKIHITGVEKQNDEEGSVYVLGENFTTYSKVYYNGEQISTEFIDSNTLKVVVPDIEMLDEFYVCQQNSKKHVLLTTKRYLYIGR